MAMDKIAKKSLAASLTIHFVFLALAAFIISLPAAKVIPLIEVNLMNVIALKEMMSVPQDSGGPKKPSNEQVKNSTAANVPSPSGNKNLLPPSEVGSTVEGSLLSTLDIVGSGVAENVRFSGGKVAGFSFTGTGIVTAKPDNVFIQFSVKSNPMPTLRATENETMKKVDFMVYNLGRLFKIKKDKFKVFGFQPKMVQQKVKKAKSLKQKDSEGNVIDDYQYKYSLTKYVVVNDLGGRKLSEICEILDKAVDYGGVAVAEIPKPDGSVEKETGLGDGDSQITAVKGATKLKFSSEMKNPNNKLVNYHFSEGTLEKLMKKARDMAYKEAKEKVDKIRIAIKFKENEMDIDFLEDMNASSDEEGAVTIKADVTAMLVKSDTIATESKKKNKGPARIQAGGSVEKKAKAEQEE